MSLKDILNFVQLLELASYTEGNKFLYHNKLLRTTTVIRDQYQQLHCMATFQRYTRSTWLFVELKALVSFG